MYTVTLVLLPKGGSYVKIVTTATEAHAGKTRTMPTRRRNPPPPLHATNGFFVQKIVGSSCCFH